MTGYIRGDLRGLRLWGPDAQQFFVTTVDADGNTILGPGAPSITAASSATTLVVSKKSANVVAIQTATSGSPPVVTPGLVNLSITATPASQSGASALTAKVLVTVAHSVLYVGVGAAIDIFYDGNTTGTPNATISGSNTTLGGMPGMAVAQNGLLYVSSESGLVGSILAFSPGIVGNVSPTKTISGPNTSYLFDDGVGGIAIGPDNTVYTPITTASVVLAFAPLANGNVAPSATIAGGLTSLDIPYGAAFDPTGTLYVSNVSNNAVTEYPAGSNGNVPATSISGSNTSISGPTAIALLPDGTLSVANATTNAVTEYSLGSTGNTPPIATIAGANTGIASALSALSIAADAAGKLYVGNATTVTVYAPGANGDVTPLQTIPLGVQAQSLAIVPTPFSL